MEYKSQNNEVEIIINYFNGEIGSLLDLGAFDGERYSNSYDLIKLGWSGILVEPVKESYSRIVNLYENNKSVTIFNCGIGTQTAITTFYQPEDAVIATTNKDLLKVWSHVTTIDEVQIQFFNWSDFSKSLHTKQFDFITIDCEGLDWPILQQMNLEELGCKCICIEYSNNHKVGDEIKNYCAKFGLTKELLRNGENIILAK